MTRLSAFLSALQMHLRQPWLQLRLAAAASALIAGVLVYAFSHQQPRPAGMQPAQVLVMDLAPRGEFLALATEDGTLEIRRAASNRVLHQRRYAHRPVRDLALFTAPATENARAQTRLIIADAMGRLEIWEAETARAVVASSAFPDSVIQPVFAVSEGGVVWASGENEEGGWLARIAPDEAEPLIFLKEDTSADGEAPTNTAPLAHGAHRLLAPGDASIVLDLPFSEPLFFSYSREPGEQSGNSYPLVPDFDVTKTHPMDGGHILVPEADALNVFHAGVTGAPEDDQPPAVTLPLTVLRPPAETIQILEGHEDSVRGAEELSDGRLLTWSVDNTARLWSASGEALSTLRGHEGTVWGAEELSDGRLLTWSLDNTARLWSASGEALSILRGHEYAVWGAEELSDGRLLTWSLDNTARLWSASGEALSILRGHEDTVWGAEELSDGRLLTRSADRTARLWSASGEALSILRGHERSVGGAEELSDGRLLTWSDDGTARLWSASGEELITLRGHEDTVRGAKELSDGRLLTWSSDNTARLWSASGEALSTLRGHEDVVWGAKEVSDGRLLTWSLDNTARLWSASGEALSTLRGHEDVVRGAEELSDGRLLTWSLDNTARLWSASGEALSTLRGHEDSVSGAELSDGRLLTWSGDGTARIWDVSSITNYAALTPLDLMFLGAEGDTPTLWSATPQQGLCRHSEAAPMECARPENDYAAARYLRPHDAQSAPRALVGDTSGHLALVQRGDDGELRTLASYHGHRAAITHIDSVQTASGHRAAIASADGHVQVLDLPKTGAPMVARTVHMAGNVVASGRALHTSMLDAIAPRVEGVGPESGETEDGDSQAYSAAFERALEFALQWDGGLVDAPNYPFGSRVNKGVKQDQYNVYREDLGLVSEDVANITDIEVRAIYLDMWGEVTQPWYPEALSIALFDTAADMRSERAIQILQVAVNQTQAGTTVDENGLPSDEMFAAIRDVLAAGDEVTLLENMINARRDAYAKLANDEPSTAKFLTGWMNRTNALAQFVGGVSVETPPSNDLFAELDLSAYPPAFVRGLEFVLQWEGGFLDDPDDPGGRTNKGVTQKTYDRWRRNKGLLSEDVLYITDEEVVAIYYVDYWKKVIQPWYSDGLSIAVFDSATNMGPRRANSMLQHAINEVRSGPAIAVDGVMGNQSYSALRDALSSGAEESLLTAYLEVRRGVYYGIVDRRPQSAKFLDRWLNRVNALAELVDVDISTDAKCEPQQSVLYFEFDSSAITSQAAAVLDQMVDNLGTCEPVSVFIEGRAGSGESAAYDRALGMRLARAVEDALIARGLNPEIIVTEVFDGSQSSVPKRDGVREPLNRRVEVTIR